MIRLEQLKNSCKKIMVLYGSGKECKKIIDYCPEYHIIGVWDPKNVESHVYGMQILSQEEICFFRTEIIVLTQQLIYNPKEYHDLVAFCEEHGIMLCDPSGTLMKEKFDRVDIWKKKQFEVTEVDLFNAIKEHDIISFDIFDTLLMRKTLNPEDVFELVQYKAEAYGIFFKDFKSIRIKAQLDMGLNNPNIFEIYDMLQKLANINNKEKETLLKLEIEIEKKVLVKRDMIICAYQYALALEKTVYLISDMYLPKHIIKDILTLFSIDNYHDIWVSCDHRCLKLDGLFELFKDAVAGNKYLHIGDNLLSDGMCAEVFGLDTFIIANPREMLKVSHCQSILSELTNLNERSLWGLCQTKLFNNPFLFSYNKETLKIKKRNDYSYIFIAALVTEFMHYFMQEVRKKSYDGILFSSRDGFLIQKLYEIMIELVNISDMPLGIYFQTSRKAAVMATEDQEAVISMMIDFSHDMSPTSLLKECFGLKNEDILLYEKSIFGDSIHAYIWAHKEAIFKRAKMARRNYYRYIGALGLEIGKKYALYDFVSSGTCQRALNKIMPFEVEGIYFGTSIDVAMEKEITVTSWLDSNDETFMMHYKRFETFMTSCQPSLFYFNDEGNPVLNKEVRTDEELQYVNDMQDGICQYFTEYVRDLYIPQQSMNKSVGIAIWLLSEHDNIDISNNVFCQLTLIDDWKNTQQILK